MEDRTLSEIRLEALVEPATDRLVDHQGVVIERLLDLDRFGISATSLMCPKRLPNTIATGECLLRHRRLSFRRPQGRTFRSAIAIAPGLNFDSLPKAKAPFQDFQS